MSDAQLVSEIKYHLAVMLDRKQDRSDTGTTTGHHVGRGDRELQKTPRDPSPAAHTGPPAGTCG